MLSTADDQGNMVAWVNSNFDSFGSGLTVPGYGFVLHNRGSLFSLDPKSPNVIAPHKRPYNTLAAGFVMDGERPLMSLLLMGGDMQAQGHAQVLVDIFDLGANLQMATDMARFRHNQVSNRLSLEPSLSEVVGKDLAAMGTTSARPTAASWAGSRRSLCSRRRHRKASASTGRAPTIARTARRSASDGLRASVCISGNCC